MKVGKGNHDISLGSEYGVRGMTAHRAHMGGVHNWHRSHDISLGSEFNEAMDQLKRIIDDIFRFTFCPEFCTDATNASEMAR